MSDFRRGLLDRVSQAEQRLAAVLETLDRAVKRAAKKRFGFQDGQMEDRVWTDYCEALGAHLALSRLQRNLKRKAKP